MLFKRRSAASTVFNEKTLWITGGYIGSQKTDTSEYVTLKGSKIGPSLPKVLGNHAMAKINESYSIVVGGKDTSKDKISPFASSLSQIVGHH